MDQALPGENGNGACPANAGRKNYNVHFIKLPITIAKKTGKEPAVVVDPNGLIFVFHEEEADVRKNDDLNYPRLSR